MEEARAVDELERMRLDIFKLYESSIEVHQVTESMATLRGVRYFAKGCRNLRELSVEPNAAGDHWSVIAVEIPRDLALPLVDVQTSAMTSPDTFLSS